MPRKAYFSERVNERLRAAALGLLVGYGTQAKLAAALGVTQGTISKFISGENSASPDLAKRLAEIVNDKDLYGEPITRQRFEPEDLKALEKDAREKLWSFAHGYATEEVMLAAANAWRVAQGQVVEISEFVAREEAAAHRYAPPPVVMVPRDDDTELAAITGSLKPAADYDEDMGVPF